MRDFGAAGDAKADDTAAFTNAMAAASAAGGGIVFIPTGNYLIKTHLDVPDHVVLQGVWRAPTARSQMHGTTLLAVEGAGDPNATPFITLHANSTLDGITVFYPDQVEKDPPTPYPWCVRGIGDNVSLVNVLLVNPYMAVDFGTFAAGRHWIHGLYGQALYRGLFIDNCFDVGRVSDVHFWPFWKDSKILRAFSEREGIAFIIGRTDWEYMLNCFCILYKVGFKFIKGQHGGGNAVLTHCGSDVGPTAVLVEAVQDHSGVSFHNSQFMTHIVVEESNKGPVKFVGCGFWGINEATRHATLAGSGQYTFDACHFVSWDRKDQGEPAILAKSGGLTVMGCDFTIPGKNQIVLEEDVQSAIIVGNRLRGGEKITNRSKGDVQIGLNTQR